MSEKSVVWAYVLWLLFGVAGYHHFYLRRDRQGVVWLLTLGGCLVGWVRDAWRIPEYVRDANNDPRFLAAYVQRLQREGRPRLRWVRALGGVTLALLLALGTRMAVPLAWSLAASHHSRLLPASLLYTRLATAIYVGVVPLATALGVHTVGNIGREKGGLWWPLLGAYLFSPLHYYHPVGMVWSAVGASFLFHLKARRFERTPPARRNRVARFGVVSVCFLLYAALWSSYVYHNANITLEPGKTTRLRILVTNFINSNVWTEFKAQVKQLQHLSWEVMYEESWRAFGEACDWNARSRAQQALNITSHAASNITEVQKTCRKMKRRFHPDREREEASKAATQEKFIEIVKSCELLQGERKDKTCLELLAVMLFLPLSPLYIPTIILSVIYFIGVHDFFVSTL